MSLKKVNNSKNLRKNKTPKKKEIVIVTGGAGLIGKPIIEWLLEKGHTVHSIDDYSNSTKDVLPKDCVEHCCDITDRLKTVNLIQKIKPDLIYHLACHPYEGMSQFCPHDISNSTLLGTLNILAGAIKAGNVRRFVNFSSMARYGKGHKKDDGSILGAPYKEWYTPAPEDVYAAAKVAAEESVRILCDLHGIEWCNVVPHNVYGEASIKTLNDPYRGVLLIWVNALLKGNPIFIYGDGKQVRSPSYVGDVAGPMAKMGFVDGGHRQTVNIGAFKEYSINEMAEITCKTFAEVTGKKYKKPLYKEGRPCEVKISYNCHKKSVELLGYKDKTTLKEGIAKLIKWAMKIAPNGTPCRYLEKLEIEKKAPKYWTKKEY